MSTRFVLVDDTDARIEYSADPWFLGRNQDVGFFGPVWNDTLHGVSSNASLSFTFNGSSVLLYGTITQGNLNGVPTWNCFLDGVGINNNISGQGAPFPSNNWELCANDVAVDDGSHTVTLQTTVIAGNQTFWFDYIKYAPALDASLENENIHVDDTDPEIRYGGIWDSASGFQHTTNETGANVGFSFIGTSITWYGAIVPSPKNLALSTYSIDGQNVTSFEPLGGGTGFVYNQVLFRATSLSMGLHNLQVVYNGTEEDTPLNIDFLVIQNGSIPTTSTPTIIDSPTPTPSPANGKAHKVALEATCATLGALIILGGLGILFLRRRRKYLLTPFPIAPVSLVMPNNPNLGLADIPPSPIVPQNPKSVANRLTSPPQDRTSAGGVPRRTTRLPNAEPSRELPPNYTLLHS